MTGITVTIGDRQVRDMLRRLQRASNDLRPAMARIGAFLDGRIRLGFHDARDPWGTPWHPLSSTTVSRRRGNSDRPLRNTGRLMNSITHNLVGRHVVEVGTNVEYAATHQFGARKGKYGRTRRGAPIPWGDVPARPFMPVRGDRADLPDDWVREITRTIERHLTEAT